MTADALFLGGTVLTLDPDDRVAEGVLVRGERVLAVGDARELRERAQAGVREIDLGGGVLIPGLVDAHSHVGMVGDLALHNANLNSPPIGDVKTMADVVDRLRTRAEARPESEWVVGMGYDDTLLAEGRHPTRHDLDRVTTERPVLARHISGHLASVNSIGLERAGITRDTEAPVGGVIRVDAKGEPDGVLEETAMLPLFQCLPAASEADRLDAFAFAAASYARLGITTAQHGLATTQDLSDLDRACDTGRVPIRVVAWPAFGAARGLRDGRLELRSSPERLTVGATKLFADGSIQGYTGHLCAPYHVPFKGQQEYRGYGAMPRGDLVRLVTEVYAQGRQVAVHANGDAAIDDFLFAVEEASRAHPREDARPIVVHSQMAREDQLDRMLDLGVVPSFFCLHTYYWGDRHRDVFLGPERASRISPMRSAARRGLRFTIHTDAPVVPMDPMLLLWSAVNRRTTSGESLGPDQCLTPLEALRATTSDAAWQLHLEGDRGTIEPGKLADFALLDESPLEDSEHLRDRRVLATFVGGEPIES